MKNDQIKVSRYRTRVKVCYTEVDANVFMTLVEQKGGWILDAKFAADKDAAEFAILIVYTEPIDA